LLRTLVILAVLALASAAQASDWKTPFWDPEVMVAVSPDSRPGTLPDSRVVRLLHIETPNGNPTPMVRDSLEEIDCTEQRVRQTRTVQFMNGKPLPPLTEIQRWRPRGDELDLLLVRAFCTGEDPQFPTLPVVTGEPIEAAAAHLVAMRDPAGLARSPAHARWAPAWSAVQERSATPPTPRIWLATQATHDYELVFRGRDHLVLVPLDTVETLDDDRYRFHEVWVGDEIDTGVRATWRMREFDCSNLSARTVTTANLNAAGAVVSGNPSHRLAPFEAIAAGTVDEALAPRVCGEALGKGLIVREANLKDLISGYDRDFSPSLLRLFGVGKPSPLQEPLRLGCPLTGCRIHASVNLAIRVGLVVATWLILGLIAIPFARSRGERHVMRPGPMWAAAVVVGAVSAVACAWGAITTGEVGLWFFAGVALLGALVSIPYGLVVKLVPEAEGFTYRDMRGRVRRHVWNELRGLWWARNGLGVALVDGGRFVLPQDIDGVLDLARAARARGVDIDDPLAELLDELDDMDAERDQLALDLRAPRR